MFKKMFPSRSGGSGRYRKNSINSGEGQGIKPTILMAECKQCGFDVDTNSVDVKGGTWGAKGGYGEITIAHNGYDYYGDSDVLKGAGCPNCGSKNVLK